MSSKDIKWYYDRLVKKLNKSYDEEMNTLCSTEELLTSSRVPHHEFGMVEKQKQIHIQIRHRKQEITSQFRYKKEQLEKLFRPETPVYVKRGKSILPTDFLVNSVNDFMVKLLDYVHDDLSDNEDDDDDDENKKN